VHFPCNERQRCALSVLFNHICHLKLTAALYETQHDDVLRKTQSVVSWWWLRKNERHEFDQPAIRSKSTYHSSRLVQHSAAWSVTLFVYLSSNRCNLRPVAIPTVCTTLSTTNRILLRHSFVKVEKYFKISEYLLCNGDLAGLRNTVYVLCCEYLEGHDNTARSWDRSGTSCVRYNGHHDHDVTECSHFIIPTLTFLFYVCAQKLSLM
jgi:hypothetical protein